MVASNSARERLKNRLFGKPLPRDQEEAKTVPSFQALPILSSDALSSVAYATDAALGVLILAGSGALATGGGAVLTASGGAGGGRTVVRDSPLRTPVCSSSEDR